MKKSHPVIFTVCFLFILNGCFLQEIPLYNGFVDQNLQGYIRSNSFAAVSGYAEISSYNNNEYDVLIFPVSPNTGYEQWEYGAYTAPEAYPFLIFSIGINDGPKTYSVSFFDSEEDILLAGRASGSEAVFFDSGQIEITEVDTVNHVIAGRIWGVSNEKTSSISGTFQVVIEH